MQDSCFPWRPQEVHVANRRERAALASLKGQTSYCGSRDIIDFLVMCLSISFCSFGLICLFIYLAKRLNVKIILQIIK